MPFHLFSQARRACWHRLTSGAAGVLVALGLTACASTGIDMQMNRVKLHPPYQASAAALALHQTLFVADLHDDVLMWARDLLQRYDFGHSDLPRLQDGHVSFQVFSTVTKTPRGLNFERNSGDSDNITPLAMVQGWPRATWGSLVERALYQAGRLDTAAAASQGQLRVVRSQKDLRDALASSSGGRQRVLGLLSTEGLHAIEGRMDNLDRLYDAGFRMAGLTHFFDNEVGGSAHGMVKGGLTPFGREVVARMEAKNMIVDLAHASPAVVAEVLQIARRPVVVSHTGVQATCPGPRNLSDAQARAIAAQGGLIGIGYFEGAVCGLDAPSIVRAITHVARLVGVQHVALGSDFDGATTAAFDTTGLVLITEGLMNAGFSPDEIADIMGRNVLRFLQSQLPPA